MDKLICALRTYRGVTVFEHRFLYDEYFNVYIDTYHVIGTSLTNSYKTLTNIYDIQFKDYETYLKDYGGDVRTHEFLEYYIKYIRDKELKKIRKNKLKGILDAQITM